MVLKHAVSPGMTLNIVYCRNFLEHSRFQTFAVIWILYIFFWVFPRHQIVVGRRFGTLCQFHLQRLDVDSLHPAFEDGTDTVPKHQPTTIWRRGNTQKNIYNILGTLFCKWTHLLQSGLLCYMAMFVATLPAQLLICSEDWFEKLWNISHIH